MPRKSKKPKGGNRPAPKIGRNTLTVYRNRENMQKPPKKSGR